MVCFCKHSLTALPLVQLNAQASAHLAMQAELQALAGFLAGLGLPAAPWQPDQAWLEIQLPHLSLSASAMATLSAFAQLRVDALALGIDLMVPGQARALMRLTATVSARLQAMLAMPGMAGFNPAAWLQLSAALSAAMQVQAALRLGLLPSFPAGPPLGPWRPFLFRLRALLPLIAIAGQLGIKLDAHFSATLAASLRVMLQIPMPVLAVPPLSLSLMANLTAGLSAVARLGAALGIDPLAIGLPKVTLMVQERLNATVSAVEQVFGGQGLPHIVLGLPRLQAELEYCPTLMAPPAVVQAAVALSAPAVNLPALNWQVPALTGLPVLSLGLPVVAFAAQLHAALGVSLAATPCGGQCDAAALLSAAMAA